jgi:hypothetical protein
MYYATAPQSIPDNVDYLTPGKTYRAKYMHGQKFAIEDDTGEKIPCRIDWCAHIGFQSWEITED